MRFELRFEIAPTDEFWQLRSGCGAFFKGTQMNPVAGDQIAFDQIVVKKYGEKLQLILSQGRCRVCYRYLCHIIKYNGTEGLNLTVVQ